MSPGMAVRSGPGHWVHPPISLDRPSSAAREGQPERDHRLVVANQQDVADQHRVVPGLALDRREARPNFWMLAARETLGEGVSPADYWRVGLFSLVIRQRDGIAEH